MTLPPDAGGIDVIAERALGHPGPMFRTALALRDAAMGMFGVKTSDHMRAELAGRSADRIDFFPVLSRSPTEIILGEDDRHLDFRVSLLLREAAGRRELAATTVVHCHGLLGRVYLATIMAGHVMVIRSALAKAAFSIKGT